MKAFADLLDRLAFEPARNGKLRLLTNYFATVADPDRGWALAALTDSLTFAEAKPASIRALIAERVDPILFAMSYDYVGDLSETVALLWPAPEPSGDPRAPPVGPSLTDIIDGLHRTSRHDLPRMLRHWLDELDETGRWALLKLITGSLRIGVSARLAKTALADMANLRPDDVEEVWHGLEPPYVDLFAWLEGRADRPEARDLAPFRAPMLAHAIEDGDFAQLDATQFSAEWKWDGIRVQAVAGGPPDARIARLFSRAGENISAAFPDLLEFLAQPNFGAAAIDGELLILRDGRVQPFSVLQQRLNRKTVSPKLLADFPAHIRAYDLLSVDGEDLRALPFFERRKRLATFISALGEPRLDLSPLIPFSTWDELAAARAKPAEAGAGADAEAVEGVMAKRADSPYLPGRPRGYWWKWKRDPMEIDAVLMYAQRGHGKRSSFYSDYTFGVWRAGPDGDALAPVGKAYFGFTDEELAKIDRWVRNHTINRFGPVREVTAEPDQGLVFQIAFEGLARSSRHKSGIAMRFPRISRIRWDKPPREADRIEALESLLESRQNAARA